MGTAVEAGEYIGTGWYVGTCCGCGYGYACCCCCCVAAAWVCWKARNCMSSSSPSVRIACISMLASAIWKICTYRGQQACICAIEWHSCDRMAHPRLQSYPRSQKEECSAASQAGCASQPDRTRRRIPSARPDVIVRRVVVAAAHSDASSVVVVPVVNDRSDWGHYEPSSKAENRKTYSRDCMRLVNCRWIRVCVERQDEGERSDVERGDPAWVVGARGSGEK